MRGESANFTKPINAPKLRQSLARHVRTPVAEPLG